MQGYLVLGECLSVTDTRSCILPRHRSPLLCVVMMTHLTSVHFEKDIPVATLGTRRVLKRYRNSTINICKSRLEVHFVNTSVVLVLFGYSKGARKVSGKCIKGTPAVLRGCLQVTRLSITARDYFSWITSRRQAQLLDDMYLS